MIANCSFTRYDETPLGQRISPSRHRCLKPGGGFRFLGERCEILWRSRSAFGTRLTHATTHRPDIAGMNVPYQGTRRPNQSLTAPTFGASINCPLKSSRFFNGEPCHAQSTSSQLLGTTSFGRWDIRNRGGARHRHRYSGRVPALRVVDKSAHTQCYANTGPRKRLT